MYYLWLPGVSLSFEYYVIAIRDHRSKKKSFNIQSRQEKKCVEMNNCEIKMGYD